MLDYTITNTALIKLHVHVTKHRGVEVKKLVYGGGPFIFISFFPYQFIVSIIFH